MSSAAGYVWGRWVWIESCECAQTSQDDVQIPTPSLPCLVMSVLFDLLPTNPGSCKCVACSCLVVWIVQGEGGGILSSATYRLSPPTPQSMLTARSTKYHSRRTTGTFKAVAPNQGSESGPRRPRQRSRRPLQRRCWNSLLEVPGFRIVAFRGDTFWFPC